MKSLRWILTALREQVTQRLTPRRSPASDLRLRVTNLTRNTVLATHMEVANHASTRNKGLLGRDRLAPGEGLWIVPCESVHTFCMRFPIDLVYIDRKNRIRKVRGSVSPWRMSACLSAHSVIELPSGAIHATQTQSGDTLEFSPAAPSTDSVEVVPA
jgi:uncharacterized membrane protein (UPF0127 family)